MCGLQGYTGKGVDINKIKLMLFVNAKTRGRHSTGIYSPQGGLDRAAEDPDKYIMEHEVFAKHDGATTLIAHNRYATMGAKIESNAHPFIFKGDGYKVVGMHNGWLKFWEGQMLSAHGIVNEDGNQIIDVPIGEKPKYEKQLRESFGYGFPSVDSQAIYLSYIAQHFNEQTFSKWVGSAALMYTEQIGDSEEVLKVFKRDDKPLWIGEADQGFYFHSLEEGLKIIGCDNIMPLESNTVFTFHEGEVISLEYTDAPEIALEEDHKPSKFWDAVPKDSPLSKHRPAENKKTNHYYVGAGHQKTIGVGTSNSSTKDYNGNGFTTDVRSVSIPKEAVDIHPSDLIISPYYYSEDINRGVLVVKAMEGEEEFEPVTNGFKVHALMAGGDKTKDYPLHEGFAGLDIPMPNLNSRKVRIVVTDEKKGTVHVSPEIDVKKSEVVEVSLLMPFRRDFHTSRSNNRIEGSETGINAFQASRSFLSSKSDDASSEDEAILLRIQEVDQEELEKMELSELTMWVINNPEALSIEERQKIAQFINDNVNIICEELREERDELLGQLSFDAAEYYVEELTSKYKLVD